MHAKRLACLWFPIISRITTITAVIIDFWPMAVSAKSPIINLFLDSQPLSSTFPAWSLEDDIVRH